MKKRIVSTLLVALLVAVNIFAPVSAIGAPDPAESVFMEELTPIAGARYTGNQGDSFIDTITNPRNGPTDIQGNTYEHGLVAWVARWNFMSEVSWVWREYDLDQQYKHLRGKIVIIPSQNTTSFNTKIEIIGDGEVLYSIDATSTTLPTAEINVDITGVETLKISLHDNTGVAGGTSFGLANFRLLVDDIDIFSEPKAPESIADAVKTMEFQGNQYALFDYGMTWTDAKALCESMGGHLATITSQEEQDAIEELIADSTKHRYWLGASDEVTEGTWEWVTGESFVYKNWGRNEPNNGSGREDYLHIYVKPENTSVFGEWNDAFTNDAPFGFICEWEESEFAGKAPKSISDAIKTLEFEGHQYALFDYGINWEAAKALCESMGGYLATITSAEEQMAIQGLITDSNKNCYWLGGYKANNEWKWVVDSEAFAYNNWGEDEPNNENGSENYLHICTKPLKEKVLGDWNDASIHGAYYSDPYYSITNFGFICEWNDIKSNAFWEEYANTSIWRNTNNFGAGNSIHLGVDLVRDVAPQNIVAIYEGTVVHSGLNGSKFVSSSGNRGEGNGYTATLLHAIADTPFYSFYAHMKKQPTISSGSKADYGAILGEMGSTGNSTGEHLHLGVYTILKGNASNNGAQPGYVYDGGTLLDKQATFIEIQKYERRWIFYDPVEVVKTSGSLIKNYHKSIEVRCPVDVNVYDSDNNLVSSVVNNEILIRKLPTTIIDGDIKEIYFDNTDVYRIEIIATDNGVMDYIVYELNSGMPLKKIESNNIPLAQGAIFTGYINDVIDTPVENYRLSSNGVGYEESAILSGDKINDIEISMFASGEGFTNGADSDYLIVTTGDKVTVQAEAYSNSAFDGWYEDNVKIDGAGELYSFTAMENRTLEARFVPSDNDNENGEDNEVKEPATLKNLRISGILLNPAFSADIFNYTAYATESVNMVTVMPELNAGTSAVVKVNGKVVNISQNGYIANLNYGSNVISITVSEDGKETATYNVVIARAYPTQNQRPNAGNTTPSESDWHMIPDQQVITPPVAEAPEKTLGKYIVLPNNLNIRKGANTVSGIVGQFHKGDIITVISIENGWALVEYDTERVYVSAQYIVPLQSRYVVIPSALNVRSAPSLTAGNKIGTLRKGTAVIVKEIVGDWVKINFRGKEAYVSARYLKLI